LIGKDDRWSSIDQYKENWFSAGYKADTSELEGPDKQQ